MKNSYNKNISLWLMIVAFLCIFYYTRKEDPIVLKTDEEINICADDSFTIKDFVLELHIQEVQYPDIVLRQSALESGWFTSLAWKTKNNPFGFRYKGEYLMFNNWHCAIIYMKDWQNKYYKGGDYFQFLQASGYAEDTNYVETLKGMNLDNLKKIK